MPAEFTHDDFVAVFGADRVRRFGTDGLPTGIVHAPTRAFLHDVGLPHGMRDGFIDVVAAPMPDGAGWATLSARYAELSEVRGWTWPLPDDADRRYVLAEMWGGDFLLDGTSGEVWFAPEWDEAPALVHTGVDTFAAYCLVLTRAEDRYGLDAVQAIEDDPNDPRDGVDVTVEIAQSLMAELAEIDPTTFADATATGPPDLTDADRADDFAGPWTQAFEDIASGMWST